MKYPYKHGYADQIPEYSVWVDIRRRAFNPRAKVFPRYGGRGITVCARWKSSFLCFYEDMGPRPSPRHTLDRRDNNGNYSCGQCLQCLINEWPANCAWVTFMEQENNRRNNHWVTFEGRTQTLAQWARELNVKPAILRYRVIRWEHMIE